MNLHQRLTTLRQQRGTQRPSPPAPPPGPSVAEQLQRLRGAAAPSVDPAQRDTRIAALLEGKTIAPGVVVVDRHVPLSSRHGTRGLAPIVTVGHPSCEQPIQAQHLVFMDTETTGLSGGTGTLAFLLGMGRIDGELLCLRQFFLTSFAGEAALLRAAVEWIGTRRHLVTFNGKSFDAPLMATRYRLANLTSPFATMAHVDLYHPTRRAFGTRWSDCRLQTAEQRLCGFIRRDDLPSHEIPEAWFTFMRRGTTHRLPAILTHNYWDVLSLVALWSALADVFTAPGAHDADVLAIARHYQRQGDEQTALTHLHTNHDRLNDAGLLALAQLHRRRRQWQPAIAIWQRLARRACPDALVCLAKYYEHVERDRYTALELTTTLQELEPHQPEHRQRAQRLRTKLARRPTQ